jgi:DNA-binding XRE family transcriptional regulator
LAERLGVSKRSIETWERNRVKPSRTLDLKLRGFLGLPVPSPPNRLAGRLMAFRRSRKLTHGEAAQLLGVHRRTVIRWETGRSFPGRTLLVRVDAFLAGLLEELG